VKHLLIGSALTTSQGFEYSDATRTLAGLMTTTPGPVYSSRTPVTPSTSSAPARPEKSSTFLPSAETPKQEPTEVLSPRSPASTEIVIYSASRATGASWR
jgi:hypothetical protein